jgi:hypothetical protein
MGNIKGTIAYMAPEYLKMQDVSKFNEFDKLDIWAIGVIAY